MKRSILTAVVVVTAGLSGLPAQQPAAAPPAAKVPSPKSPAETKAVQALGASTDPDAVIKAAEELMTKFADTDYKEFALQMEARAYHEKRDDVNAQVYGERVLAIDPKAYMTELLVAEIITPSIKEHDLDRDEKLARAGKLFNDAIENVKAAAKPNPQLSDKDWADNQAYATAEAHNGLGMLAQVQKKWDDAVREYKLAVEGDPDQDAYSTRLAAAYLSAGKNDEALAICDKLLAKPNLHPQIKAVVTNIKTAATKK
jgi:tetratricopeptide (TPR) repeat protein